MKFPLAAFLAAAVFAGAAHAGERARVVMQVSDNDPARWSMALANAKNLKADFAADGVDIEIVAFGPGVRALEATSELAERIAGTVASGIKVTACENTLRAFKLERADMNDKIGYVPAGVGQITRLQMQGWAYLRP